MELSLSNWVFCKLPLEESVGRVAELGFRNIEFNPKCIEYEADECIQRVKGLIKLNRLTCTSVHSADTYVKKPEEVGKALRYGKASINLAKHLSSPILVVHSYMSRELDRRLRAELLPRVFGELEDYASSCRVRLAVENLSFYSKGYGRSLEEVNEILEAIGSRDMGVTLDFGHSQRIHQTFMFLKEFKTKLRNIHVSSFMHGPINEATGELEAFLRELKHIGYRGPITIEMDPKYGNEEILKTKSTIEETLRRI
jgi:sugar phosphate isomerase/epimerase